jgi:hydrogenase/urease accessory protein HupE
MRFLLAFSLLFSLCGIAAAHEMRPAYLELRQTSDDSYDALWKVPGKGVDHRLALDVRFPTDAKVVTSAPRSYVGAAFIDRFKITRAGGLTGAEIYVEGLSNTYTDALVRLERLDGTSQVTRLTPSSPSMVVAEVPSSFEVAKTYTLLGVQHILEGIDHLLFVLCLMIVAGINRKLLITITGFTIAHSVTLALSTLGIVNIPVPPVEAVIALSIVFLASEIARGNKRGLTYRFPVAVSMSFGLLHGFGFAAVLGEIGLPQNEIPTALLFFNVGVELGQILFIAALIVLAFAAKKLAQLFSRRPLSPVIWQPASAYMIGAVATYWTIERIVNF